MHCASCLLNASLKQDFPFPFILDIDECSEGLSDCDAKASCTNTVGSFTCTCNKGSIGDGKTCFGADYIFTLTGSTLRNGFSSLFPLFIGIL